MSCERFTGSNIPIAFHFPFGIDQMNRAGNMFRMHHTRHILMCILFLYFHCCNLLFSTFIVGNLQLDRLHHRPNKTRHATLQQVSMIHHCFSIPCHLIAICRSIEQISTESFSPLFIIRYVWIIEVKSIFSRIGMCNRSSILSLSLAMGECAGTVKNAKKMRQQQTQLTLYLYNSHRANFVVLD